MNRSSISIRRHRGGTWTSTVTRNGVRHVAKSNTSSPSDAALSAIDMKAHLEFLEAPQEPVAPQQYCECCSDRFGWIWNHALQTAEPCPVCNKSETWPEEPVTAVLERAAHSDNAWLADLGRRKQHELARSRIGVVS